MINMEQQKRDIMTIIQELENHPDFLGGQLWTKDFILQELSHHFQFQTDDHDLIVEENEVSDDDWSEIGWQIEHFYDEVSSNQGLPIDVNDFEDLNKRVMRKWKLEKLTGEDESN